MKKLLKVNSDAAAICARFYTCEDMQKLLVPGITSVNFLEQLLRNKFYSQAISFLAYGLPIREGVWWAYLAVVDIIGADKNNNLTSSNVLEFVKQWAYNPVENLRVAIAGSVADIVDNTPLYELAQAVICSDGAHDHIAAAIHLSIVHENSGDKFPAVVFERYHKFIKQGINIANGG